MKYILRPALTLFIIAVIVVAMLSVVYNLTLEPIEKQKQKTQEAAMKEVLPGISEYVKLAVKTSGNISAVYEGMSNNGLSGYVIMVSAENGYSGQIDVIAGISLAENSFSGVRVMRHSETPGLGALATKENFYRQYDGKEIRELSVVKSNPGKNDIQAITSATITSKAVTDAVNEAINWYLANVKPAESSPEENE